MNKGQIEGCRKRNEQLKQELGAAAVIPIKTVKRAVEDIDSLLGDLNVMANRMRVEQKSRYQLERDLANERKLKCDGLQTVEMLNEKLSKARAILKKLDADTFTAQQRKQIAGIM